MIEEHIELDREFTKIDTDRVLHDSYEYDGSKLLWSDKTKWVDILELPRVIILAEAGAGKTHEIRATTRRLRNQDKIAFFFRLEHLHSDFDDAFEIGKYSEFVDWEKSSKSAWFFLDSVDEARLGSPHQYEKAIRLFSRKLGSNMQRAKIYLTSRVSEWRAKSDLNHFKEKLPFVEIKGSSRPEDQEESLVFSEGAQKLSDISALKEDTKEVFFEPVVYTLSPLTNEQIRIYAHALHVDDVDQFVIAIQKADATDFTTRPLDLEELIQFWKKHKKIANRKELLESNVESRLSEKDIERGQARPLSSDEAMKGIQIIAAATTFQKVYRIIVPDNEASPDNRRSLDTSVILFDWDSKKIQALLSRPIFDEEIYGAVRFYHRSVREYLTAKWLYSLLRKGLSRRHIEGLFFQNRYGCEVVVPSLRPVLSWLILLDQEIMERTIKVSPELLIQGGDPSALPMETRKGLLREICSLHENKDLSIRNHSFDISELRRFANPDLTDEINELLAKHLNDREISELLLRIIWQGELSGCRDIAFECARNSELNIYTQIYGIRAVEAVGTDSQKSILVDELCADFKTIRQRIASELIVGFAPDLHNACYTQ